VIRRARLALCAAVVLAAVIVGAELPLGQLLQGRAAIASSSAQLKQLQSEGSSLASEVNALGQDPTIAQIAHQQYGLVRPGQEAFVVLPGPGDAGGSGGPLSNVTVPKGDIMPSDALVGGGAGSGATSPAEQLPGSGFARQFLSRLEFWRWAF
jgi:cell division protein FtsB